MNWESGVLDLLSASLVRPVILALAAAAILRIFRVDHPASKHAVWTVVLAGMLIVPLASVVAPSIDLPALPQGMLSAVERRQEVKLQALPSREAGTERDLASPLSASEDTDLLSAPGRSGRPAEIRLPAAQTVRDSFLPLSPAKFLLWSYFTVLAAFSAYRVAGWVLLRRVLARSRPIKGDRLLESADVVVPVAVGVFRPAVILPREWRCWPSDIRRAVLAHEFEHVRRRDAWVLSLSRWVRCIFWFHPLAWWLSRKVADLAEFACDAAAVGRFLNAERYSQILLEFAEEVQRRGHRASLPGLAMVGTSSLSRRIDQLLSISNGGSRRLSRPLVFLTLIGLPVCGAVATLRLTEAAAQPLVEVKMAVATRLETMPGAQPLMQFGAAVASTLESFVQVTARPEPVAMIAQAIPTASPAQRSAAPREFLDRYCTSCHNQQRRIGNLTLDDQDLSRVPENPAMWERVVRKLRSGIGHTPLPAPLPDSSTVRAFAEWLENEIDRNAMPFLRMSLPHRLNRTEYGNAVRDLLGLEINPALLLPSDDSTQYFDNIAEALSTPLALTDAYAAAAERISRLAMASSSRSVIFVCRPAVSAEEAACAQQIVTSLVARAFRGLETAEDVKRILQVYQSGRKTAWGFESGVEAALRSILTDPKFLYRTESVPEAIAAGQAYRIGDLELASRLSFFLWSTGPDTALLELARRGELRNPNVLEREVRRMLKDPRAEALSVNFAAQWLWLRGMQTVGPLPLFPDFDEPLRQSMRQEVELFFNSIVQEDRNVVDLLNADYTFVNDTLARHYGMTNIQGNQMRRITLGDAYDVRRGLLGKSAILTVTSRPDRTSLTTRGNWAMSMLLGVPPPDPPPDIPPMPRTRDVPMREFMEQQLAIRNDCRLCHRVTDPIGIALDNFDPIGRWRTQEYGKSINTATELVDGTKINGPADLRNAILAHSDQFVSTLTFKLYTYALGRRTGYQDMPAIRAIVRDAAREDNRFSAIILGIVKSAPFQMNVK